MVALKSPSVLQIYLISDPASASSVIGLNSTGYWWRRFEVIIEGLSRLLSVYIFGTIDYVNARDGANLISTLEMDSMRKIGVLLVESFF